MVIFANASRGVRSHQSIEKTLQGEIRHVLFAKVRVEHRPMKCNEIGLLQERAVQRSNIAVANKYFWISPNHLIIEQWQKSRGSVTSAHAEDRLHFGVAEHAHQIPDSFIIAARQEPSLFFQVPPQLYLESEGLEDLDGSVDGFGIDWRARRRDDSDGVPLTQPWRFDRHW